MEFFDTVLRDCYVIQPDKFGDDRGYFSPEYIEEELAKKGFKGIRQVSESKSKKGVVRGLHYQYDPYSQAKIVRVTNGAVIDVAVDIREGSSTFGQAIGVLLTGDNNKQLLVPRGFAHGFVSLEDNTKFEYYVDNKYMPTEEGGILWNDKDLNIPWDKWFKEYGITNPELSKKDIDRQTFEDYKNERDITKKYILRR